MAYDEFQDRADQSPPPVPQRRSVDDEALGAEYDQRESRRMSPPPTGGCSKGCLYGLAGCGCLSVILIGVVGFFAFRFFGNAISTDPVQVVTASKEIADFDMPADLKPKVRMNLLQAMSVKACSR
jgi:hypothetical protein